MPAGLTLYWFFNNIITTTQTVYLRKTTKPLVNVGGNGTAGNGGAASSQPVRVDYVPKRERRSGATIPKVAAPKVDVSNAISAEFTDFDDGPAKVKSALESEFGDFEDGPAKVQEDDGGDSRGSRKGSRKWAAKEHAPKPTGNPMSQPLQETQISGRSGPQDGTNKNGNCKNRFA